MDSSLGGGGSKNALVGARGGDVPLRIDFIASEIAVQSRAKRPEDNDVNVNREDRGRQAGAATGDLDRFFALRRFIEDLAASGEVSNAAMPRSISLASPKILDGNPAARCIFARSARSARSSSATSVSSRARVARAFGVAPERLAAEIQRRLANKPEIVEVTRAEAAGPAGGRNRHRRSHDAPRASPARPRRRGPTFRPRSITARDPHTGFTNVGNSPADAGAGAARPAVDLVSPSDLRAALRGGVRRKGRPAFP